MFLVNNRANYQDKECKITISTLSDSEVFKNKLDATVSRRAGAASK